MKKSELRNLIREELLKETKETIRVFKSTKMKVYDSEDIDPNDIISRSKDIKMKGWGYSDSAYLINRVTTKNKLMPKGYVWSVNQKFDN